MAIRLREQGIDDFVVLERDDDVGGTWWDNTYPGCACDVPSHLYSFSFAPNPDWSRTYSPQPEIRAYLQRCAERYGLRPLDPARRDGERRRVGRGRRPLDARDRARAASPRASLIAGARPAERAARSPTSPGSTASQGTDVPLRPLGPRPRPRPAARRGRSAPARRRSSSSPRSSREVEQLTSSSARRRGSCRTATGPITRRSSGALYRRFPALQRLVRAGVYSGRELLVLGFAKQPAAHEAVASGSPAGTCERRSRDPALRAR